MRLSSPLPPVAAGVVASQLGDVGLVGEMSPRAGQAGAANVLASSHGIAAAQPVERELHPCGVALKLLMGEDVLVEDIEGDRAPQQLALGLHHRPADAVLGVIRRYLP